MSTTIRVLLVDDEPAIHSTLGVYLKRRGHQVDSALDGSQALKAMETSDHDLIIADIRMPIVDGLTLLKKVKSENPHVPVIMISGHGDAEIMEEASRLGANAFLPKPYRFSQIDELIRDLTGGDESSTDRLGVR